VIDRKEVQPKKRGKKSWKPSTLLHVQDANPAYKFRWAYADAANLKKKEEEQWEYATNKDCAYTRPKAATVLGLATDPGAEGETLSTSLIQYRECVLMKMDIETAEARMAYYDELTDSRSITPNKFRDEVSNRLAEVGVEGDEVLYDTIN